MALHLLEYRPPKVIALEFNYFGLRGGPRFGAVLCWKPVLRRRGCPRPLETLGRASAPWFESEQLRVPRRIPGILPILRQFLSNTVGGTKFLIHNGSFITNNGRFITHCPPLQCLAHLPLPFFMEGDDTGIKWLTS